jgi:hypothetical protein
LLDQKASLLSFSFKPNHNLITNNVRILLERPPQLLRQRYLDGQLKFCSGPTPEKIIKILRSLLDRRIYAIRNHPSQKRDHIQKRGLPTRVRSDQHVEGPERLTDVAEAAIVERFDEGDHDPAVIIPLYWPYHAVT